MDLTNKTMTQPSSRTPGVPKAWAFNATDREVATFLTCLKTLLHAIDSDKVSLEALLVVLWEVTHFPPACLALAELQQTPNFDVSSSRPLAVFAHTFYVLCLKVVPSWVSRSPTTVLEASRQIFVWFYSLQPSYEAAHGHFPVLVNEVELSEVKPADQADSATARTPSSSSTTAYVDVPKTDTESGNILARVCVGSDKVLRRVSPKTLAVALSGEYASLHNLYFELPQPSHIHVRHHSRRERPNRRDFENLLDIANQDEIFRMTHPLQLAETPSASLPVATLSGRGFVSIYDQEDEACGERYFYM